MTKELIREARESDIPNLLELLSQLSPPKPGEVFDKQRIKEEFMKIKRNSDYYLCVYEIDDRLAATGMLLIQRGLAHQGRPQGHIENIVTDNGYRGRGLGKKIIHYLTEVARKKGCYKTVLVCKPENAGFYEKCGLKMTEEVEMRQNL